MCTSKLHVRMIKKPRQNLKSWSERRDIDCQKYTHWNSNRKEWENNDTKRPCPLHSYIPFSPAHLYQMFLGQHLFLTLCNEKRHVVLVANFVPRTLLAKQVVSCPGKKCPIALPPSLLPSVAYGVTTDGKTTFINASTCDLRYEPVQPPIIFDLPNKVSASTAVCDTTGAQDTQ